MQIPQIKFGTDGWRGILADDFTYDNMALVGTAVERHLTEQEQGGLVLIGYDRRFAAEAYAAHLAKHLRNLGREVVLVHEPCPTPVVAFGVLHLRAACAIQLTASHNPYYQQGFKFIPHFAGPAMPTETDNITRLIPELAPDFDPPQLCMEWDGETVDLKDAYFEHLDKIVNANSLTSGGMRVLYNPMHGVGTGYLDEYLRRAGLEVVTINGERDVYFGTCLPDPSPGNLVPLANKLIEENCTVLIGTDGDADRFGLVDPEGRYFGANQALPLLADYLIRYKQFKGDLVRTVSTSHLLDGVAKEHGLKLIETPVGFKYVGDELRKGAIIGGEESGGISIKGHVPEKDGILASVLMLELAATTGDGFHKLLTELMERLGPVSFQRIDQEMPEERKQKLFASLADFDAAEFAGHKIAKRIDTDGVKFVLDNGWWVLMRPSGTEPLVRIYIECAPDALNKFKTQVLDAVQKLGS